jgi:thiol-disulfide isomerase/thioredoxin
MYKPKSGMRDKVYMIWFYRPTCPWCAAMESEWKKFKEKYINEKMIDFVDVDIRNLQMYDSIFVQLFNNSKKTVPQIILLYKGQIESYESPDRTSDKFDQWLADTTRDIDLLHDIARQHINRTVTKNEDGDKFVKDDPSFLPISLVGTTRSEETTRETQETSGGHIILSA